MKHSAAQSSRRAARKAARQTQHHAQSTRATWQWALGLLLFCFALYQLNGDYLYGSDQYGNMILAMNLLENHSFIIAPQTIPDQFEWVLTTPGEPDQTYRFKEWNAYAQHLYEVGRLTPTNHYHYFVNTVYDGYYANTFGIGAALMVLPVYALINLFTDITSNYWWLWYGTKFTVSLLSAATATLIFLTLRDSLRDANASPWLAVLPALAFALGSCAWSMSSQSLWQHAPFDFWLALGAYFFLGRHREHLGGALAVGVAAGMATLCRPTGVLFVVVLGVYYLIFSRRQFALFALGGLPFAAAFFWYNQYYFGGALITAQQVVAGERQDDLWGTPLWRGVAGLLISPSRGLFIFSPVFLFGVVGAYLAWKELPRYRAYVALQVVATLMLLTTAVHHNWTGGWSFGPRTMVDVSLLLALLMLPVMQKTFAKPLLCAAFIALLGYSAAVQFIGVSTFNYWSWNNRDKQDIDLPQYRHRLWSVSDNQLAHYVTNFGKMRKLKLKTMAHFLDLDYKALLPTPEPADNALYELPSPNDANQPNAKPPDG